MTHNELQNNSSNTGTKVPMTHDELLAKIDSLTFDMPADYGQFILGDSIKAVFELANKDIKNESYAWLDGYDFAMKQVIQAIEKELI